MAQFTMTIEMGNAAMQTPADIARATRLIFGDFARQTEVCTDGNSGRIYDANGNKVGTWSLDEMEDENADDEEDDEE